MQSTSIHGGLASRCPAQRARWSFAWLVAGLLCAAPLRAAEPGRLRLEDLWEDTPATRDLSHQFHIYKRKQLPSHLHQQLRLYLVYPEEAKPSERRPAVVFIHGGGWGAGNPDQWFPQCRYFALRGLVGVSVNYRLKSDITSVADCVTDCKSAIRYLRRNAGKLGIDPKKIVVVGESAGGHLAAALGTIAGYDEPGEDTSVSAVPNALVLLNPITDLTTRWGESLGEKATSLSPLHHVTTNTPPTLLIHGDADRVVDLQHARSFHEKMIALGNRSQLIILPGADHAFAIFKYGPDDSTARAIIEIDRYLTILGYLSGKPLLQELTNP